MSNNNESLIVNRIDTCTCETPKCTLQSGQKHVPISRDARTRDVCTCETPKCTLWPGQKHVPIFHSINNTHYNKNI